MIGNFGNYSVCMPNIKTPSIHPKQNSKINKS